MNKREYNEFVELMKEKDARTDQRIKQLEHSLTVIEALNENDVHHEAIRGIKWHINSLESDKRRRNRVVEREEYKQIHGEPESLQLYRHETGGL